MARDRRRRRTPTAGADATSNEKTSPEEKPRRRKRRPKRRQWFRRRLEESVSTVRGVVSQPRNVPAQIREALLTIWRVRGGGFYGLGYVVAFAVLEVRAFVGNFQGDGDITSMVVQEVLGFFFRFAAQSFINGFIAFGWPIFVVQYLGPLSVVALAVAWLAFDRWAKPWINARVPQLAPQEAPPPESQNPPPE
jgi:hypothetical protein